MPLPPKKPLPTGPDPWQAAIEQLRKRDGIELPEQKRQAEQMRARQIQDAGAAFAAMGQTAAAAAAATTGLSGALARLATSIDAKLFAPPSESESKPTTFVVPKGVTVGTLRGDLSVLMLDHDLSVLTLDHDVTLVECPASGTRKTRRIQLGGDDDDEG